MRTRIIKICLSMLWVASAYLTCGYVKDIGGSLPWYVITTVSLALFYASLLFADAFVSRERKELKDLLQKIERDLVDNARVSTEHMEELSRFRTVFGFRLRKKLFSVFKKH
jgi:hypothetical protein